MSLAIALSAFLSVLVQDETPTPPKPEPVAPADEKRVVVTAARAETDALDVPASVTVITRADIEKSNARTVVDVLQGRPGLTLNKFSSTPQDASLDARGFNNRGNSGSHLLVLVDGRKANLPASGAVDWAAIPLHDVERIEILRGPAASLYGDNAVAGVISITTRRAGAATRHTAAASAGSFGTHQETAGVSVSSDPLAFTLSASIQDSEGFRDNSAYQAADGSGMMEYVFPGGTAWFRFTLHDDTRERPGSLTKAEMDVVGRDGSVTTGDDSEVGSRTFDVGSDLELAGGTLTPVVSLLNHASESVITGFGGVFSSDADSEILGAGARWVRAFGAWRLVAGLEGSFESAEATSHFDSPGFVSDSDSTYDREILGGYVRLEWRPWEALILSASLRHDRARIDYETTSSDTFTPPSTLEGDEEFGETSPMVGVTWHVRPETSVFASWGRTFRLPNRDELVGFLTTALNLDPERAWTLEVGVRSREWELLTGSLAAYVMDVEDEIFFHPPEFGEDVSATFNFGANENFDLVRHAGIELELESAAHERVDLFGSATVQRTVVRDGPHAGNEMPNTPRFAATLGARVLVLEGLTAQAAVRYMGERYATNDVGNDVDKLADYAVLDVKVVYRWRKLTLFADVNNALGMEYDDNGGLRIPFGVFGSQAAFFPAPEESFLVGASLEF